MSACEASGEAHCSLLVRELKSRHDGIEIEAVGGPAMERAGAKIVESSEKFAVMGLAEGIGAIPAHLRALRRLRKRFQSETYDLVVLVDYPGFHLRVAAAASRCGIPVLYYIAPQLWAWGAWRVNAMRKHVRKVAAVLPFEERFYRSKHVDAEFVGHPLLDRGENSSKESARASLNIDRNATVLGLLPGSRRDEVKRLWPPFRDAANLLRQYDPKLQVLVATVEGDQYPGAREFQLCPMDSTAVIAASDAVLCKSGTATLESALAGTPAVIAYRMHPFTYWIAKRAVTLPHVGLANLIAEREICPEYLQSAATPDALARAVAPLLDRGTDAADKQRDAFAEVRARLGGPGATRKVVEMAERMVA